MSTERPTPENANQRLDHLPALDGLRGIAVLMVLWFHIPPSCLPEWSGRLIRLFHPGYFGVDFFFVLSGFLITRILLDYRRRGVPLKVFFVRRFLRIFPAYYLLIAIMALVAPTWRLLCCTVYLANLEWPPYLAPPHSLHHLWSLSVEEHFYLVWPFVIALPSVANSRRLVTWFVIPMSIACAVGFALYYEGAIAGLMIWENTLPRSLSLAAGGLLAFHEAALRSKPGRSAMVSLLAAVVAAGALVVGRKLVGGDGWFVVRLVAGAAFSTSVVSAVICAKPEWAPARALAVSPLRKIGQISYGLYLYHHPIYYYTLMSDEAEPTPTWAAVAVALSFAAAIVSYNAWEKPFLRLKDVLGLPKPDPAAAEGADPQDQPAGPAKAAQAAGP